MVVRACGFIWSSQPETPRHPQMHDLGLCAEIEQQVFATAANRFQPSAAKSGFERIGDGPAQPRLTDDHAHDLPPRECGQKPGAGGFDFGEFWHARIVGG